MKHSEMQHELTDAEIVESVRSADVVYRDKWAIETKGKRGDSGWRILIVFKYRAGRTHVLANRALIRKNIMADSAASRYRYSGVNIEKAGAVRELFDTDPSVDVTPSKWSAGSPMKYQRNGMGGKGVGGGKGTPTRRGYETTTPCQMNFPNHGTISGRIRGGVNPLPSATNLMHAHA